MAREEIQTIAKLTHAGDSAPTSIAVRQITATQKSRPGLFWINGFMSVMAATKVTALSEWARENDRALIKFDYSGHGESDGKLEEGTIGRWLAEAEMVFRQFATGPQIIVGSSMGGWIALLLNRLLARRPDKGADVHAIVLIAPAIDMSERLMWQKFPDNVCREILDKGFYQRPSAYGDGPYLITRKMIEDGRDHLLLDAPFGANCPVRILHGMQDPDVPWQSSLDLMDHLEDGDVVLELIKDGDHRLSRNMDIARLIATIEALG